MDESKNNNQLRREGNVKAVERLFSLDKIQNFPVNQCSSYVAEITGLIEFCQEIKKLELVDAENSIHKVNEALKATKIFQALTLMCCKPLDEIAVANPVKITCVSAILTGALP